MARKTTTSKKLDDTIDATLEEALEMDLDLDYLDDDFEIDASMDELEAQIAQAADELAKENGDAKPAAQSKPARSAKGPTVAPPSPLPEMPPAPANVAANDDRQRDFRSLLATVNRRTPTTVYWTTAFVSILWILGGLSFGHLLYSPQIWEISTFQQFFSTPYAVGLAVGIVIPILFFWGFAVMVRRSQEMRLAARSMTEVAAFLVEPENIAQDRVMTVGQAVRREVQAMGDGIERTLARAVELEALVHTEVNELERAYSENERRIRSLVDGLGSERDAVVSHAERVRSSIAGAHEQLKEELNSASDIIRDTVDNASSLLTTTINESGELLVGSINDSGSRINESIADRLEAVSGRITTSGEAVASLLDTRIAKIGESFDTSLAGLTSSMDGRSKTLAEEFDMRVAALNTGTEKINSVLDSRLTAIETALGESGNKIAAEIESRVSGLDAGTESIKSTLDAQLAAIEGTFSERGKSLIGEFETRITAIDNGTEKLNSALETRARQINETLVERTRGIAGVFAEGRETITSMIEEGKARIGADMAELVMSTSTMLETRAGEFADKLNVSRDQISATLDADMSKIIDLRDGIAGVLTEDIGRIEDAFRNHTGVIEERTKTMEKALGMGVGNVRAALEGSAVDVAKSLSESVANATRTLGQSADAAFEEADRKIMARTHQTSAELDKRADAIASAFDQADSRIRARIEESAAAIASRNEEISATFDAIDQRLMARTHQTSAELDKRTEVVEASLAAIDKKLIEGADGVIDRLSNISGSMAEKVTAHITSAESKLSAKADQLSESFAAINAHIEERTSETTRSLSESTKELNSMLASRSSEISRILDEKARPLIEAFAASGGELQKSLENATALATERLRSESAELVKALANRTADTLSAVENSQNSLTENVGALIDRLSSSNSKLGELMELASHSLSEVEGRLSGTTDRFNETAEKAAQSLSTSSRIIDANTGKLAELSSDTLGQIAAIANRFEDHGKMLASANDLLGSAQSNLSSTLEDRRDALESLALGLVAKSEEIEKVMRTFEGMVERAASSAEGRTRDTASQMQSVVNEVIDSASQRFADATSEMRETANSIRRELEETRSELKRGVLDLPEETKESTSALRRAVADQIGALKELTNIVTSSGRGLDVSGSRERSPELPQPVRPAPQPERQSDLRGGHDAPVATAPAPARAPAARDNASGGWVQDLLRRASTDDEPAAPAHSPQQRSPLHIVESLNSLSVDIARAIDHDASVDLWDRYRRGERGIFTRRLYTIKGQQTFDEIRSKYQQDREFREAVDRYCLDFEKLLKDVARNDRENIMTQTYLTSDTGKVYTMLAHASGRLR